MTDAASIRLTIAHPLLSQPLGCDGNALVLASRAERRGISASIAVGHGDEPLPEADIYLIGGVPTRDQAELADRLHRDESFLTRSRSGAVVLGVNAGFEILGDTFADVDGTIHDGLGLAEFVVHRGSLAEGPVVTVPGGPLNLPALSGFEVHTGRCVVGDGCEPLTQLEIGVGNGDERRGEGVLAGHVMGTYLHGPVLVRNPELADIMLEWALGKPLPPLDPGAAEELRRQRIAEDRADPTGWGGRQYGWISLIQRVRRLFRSR